MSMHDFNEPFSRLVKWIRKAHPEILAEFDHPGPREACLVRLNLEAGDLTHHPGPWSYLDYNETVNVHNPYRHPHTGDPENPLAAYNPAPYLASAFMARRLEDLEADLEAGEPGHAVAQEAPWIPCANDAPVFPDEGQEVLVFCHNPDEDCGAPWYQLTVFKDGDFHLAAGLDHYLTKPLTISIGASIWG